MGKNASALRELALDNVEQEIVDSLRDLHKTVVKSWRDSKCTRRNYTHAVKKAVGGLGEKLGYSVCSHHHDYCEWLYDLCWRKLDKNELVLDVPLVMEVEWNWDYSDILDDFQKLMIARADHRIFLCEQEPPRDWKDCVRKFIEQVRCYAGTDIGDRYLFGSWTQHGWDFKQYIHNPQADPR